MATTKPISRSGRFQNTPDAEVRHFTQSVSFDWRLNRQDIAGSIAHATMLAKIGILKKTERDQIVRGLKHIQKEIEQGRFPWKTDLEDVHMNIEAVLTGRVPSAAKLHTGRSRNDQVATDMRLWLKDEVRSLKLKIRNLQQALLDLAERTRLPKSSALSPLKFLPLPGYTHLQRAQPILAAHHFLAYVEMLERDTTRFADCARRADVCPLGSGALAGSSLPLDRKLTSKLLGFRKPSANSLDAVSDRDFVAEFTFAAALTGAHLSRLAEDWILWSSAEFGFITIGDSHTTGSSLMPQKKNPDVAELGRGKTGLLYGKLIAILTILKGLPMSYNRDFQEDKPLLFDSASILSSILSVFTGMLGATEFNHEACVRAVSDPNLLATELVDCLVRKGVPFRQAHHAVGAAVGYAEQHDKSLNALSETEWGRIQPKFGKDIFRALQLSEFFKSRDNLFGAPGPKQIERQLKRWQTLFRAGR